MEDSATTVKLSSVFRDLRGGSVKLSRPMSMLDQIAQAALVTQFVRNTLASSDAILIRAYYTIAGGDFTARKESDCRMALNVMQRFYEWRVDPHYLRDLTREWAGMHRHHDDEWWSGHLKMTERNLRYYRLGREDRDMPGLFHMLNLHLGQAQGRLEDPMFEAGLIP